MAPAGWSGYTEASRGCKHLCRHCPIVPVYGGQFRVVPVEVTLADIAAQVEQGAEHITFGDPDFFNGPTHARRLVESLATRFPGLSYDVTIKVEHLRSHADLLPVLRDTGCLFVLSAVEAVDDHILERLDKGHTRADVVAAVAAMRDVGLPLAPTFVAFTPWTTLEGYVDLLQTITDLDVVEAVASIQLAIRLLLPAGSRLMELPEIRSLAGSLDPIRAGPRVGTPGPSRRRASARRPAARRPQAPRAAHGGVRRRDGAGVGGRRPARARHRPAARRARDRAFSDRALVLLSGAHRRAGGSSMNCRLQIADCRDCEAVSDSSRGYQRKFQRPEAISVSSRGQ